MRSEQEMFDLILGVAMTNERVRAVYMNGSRTNPNVPKDRYQDFDVVFVVSETRSFLADKSWISVFGKFAIVQEPDSNDLGWGKDHDFSRSYTRLMLLEDGNRIDLGIKTLECALDSGMRDSLCIKLLDKDNCLPQIPESNDSSYWIKPPSRQEYAGCCNEFWWCLNNVAKGIARDQMPYALRMYYETVHAELEKMVEWYIGMQHSFVVSTGMWGKYFKKYLPPAMYEQYLATYASATAKDLWDAVFNACSLFGRLAAALAEDRGYPYCAQEAQNVLAYLERVKQESFPTAI